MSRDYHIVNLQKGKERFWFEGPTFNVNVWTVEYYGRIFQHLGLPTDPLGHTEPWINEPAFKHEYKGADLEAVRKSMSNTGCRGPLIEAVQQANEKMDYNADSAENIADQMLREVFPLFLDPVAISVASDYCEQYYDDR